VHSPLVRPHKELKGFQKVSLRPGESKKLTITLDRRSLAYYNVEAGTWDVAPGAYRILVGSSSQDIELQRPLVNLFPSSLSVLASTPVPGQQRDAKDFLSTGGFAGWSGDTQILPNPSLFTTTATMASIDVMITATYSDGLSSEQSK
jgi:hypothetical protein